MNQERIERVLEIVLECARRPVGHDLTGEIGLVSERDEEVDPGPVKRVSEMERESVDARRWVSLSNFYAVHGESSGQHKKTD
jgi:hypothetical protein